VQADAQLLGHPQGVVALGLGAVLPPDGVCVPLDAEAGEKIDALDMDALLQHHLGGEHGIETTGDEGNGFAGRRHDRQQMQRGNRVWYRRRTRPAETR
jgi:hypothetical protein